jgi:phosphate transport system permease protein
MGRAAAPAPRACPSGAAARHGRRAALALLAVLAAAAAGPVPATLAAAAVAGAVLLARRTSARAAQGIAFGALALSVLAVLLVLGVVVSFVVARGLPALSWGFLASPPRDLGRAGGILPAIVGTAYLVGGAILVALPVGVGAGVYLAEYTREGPVTRVVRAGIDLLNGTPSIIFGLFGFAFLVLYLGLGVSLLSGQLTLALMVLPTIVRTTEEAIRAVPQNMREASLGLGATKLQTIAHVVLPPALPGILTGVVLSIGRAAGETAPVMFTAVVFSQRWLPTSLSQPVMALPYHLYVLSTNVPGADANRWGTALVLLALVVGVYAVAVLLRERYHVPVHG